MNLQLQLGLGMPKFSMLVLPFISGKVAGTPASSRSPTRTLGLVNTASGDKEVKSETPRMPRC